MKSVFLIMMTVLLSSFGRAQCSADFSSATANLDAYFTNLSVSPFTSYYWDFGDGNTSSAQDPVHTYSANGTYTVCLSIFYNDSITFCSDSVCYPVTVFDSIGGGCVAISDFSYTTSGNTALFTNLSSSSSTPDYYWNFGDGSNSTSTNPSHTYSMPGTYTVCLSTTVFDSLGGWCYDSLCYPVTVFDSSGGGGCVAISNFTYNTSGNTALFTNLSSSSSTPDYYWNFGDGTNSTSTNPSHTYSFPGTYTVCLSTTVYDSLGGWCYDSLCYPVTVFDSSGGCVAISNFTWNISGTTAQFSNMSASSSTPDYYWNFGDGNNSTSTNPSHTYANPGTYTVCLTTTVYDTIGGLCYDSLCYSVSVMDSLGAVTVKELDAFKLYPNPTSDVLTISFDTEINGSAIRILDVTGREMMQLALEAQATKLYVSELPDGLYIVQIIDPNQQLVGLKKFIKQ